MNKIQNRNVILLILTLVYAFNFVDRQILGILAPFIQADLDLTDGQLGLLAGFFFALFYTIIGLPIAWLADRYNRITIVSVALATWSGFTALSGFVSNYAQLALARMGVGIGEAGCSPPSHSLISDFFAKEERGKALAIYSMGIPFGIMTAFFVAAAMMGQEQFNWRLIFITLGVPGVLLAVFVRLFIPEPERGQSDSHQTQAEKSGLMESLRTLSAYPSYWAMCLGISLASFAAYGASAFLVLFITRQFPDVSVPKLLVYLGVIHGIAYAWGTYLGGSLGDRWGRKTPAGYAFIAIVGLCIATPFLLGALWAPSWFFTVLLIAGYLFFIGFYLGPSFSVAQTLAPINMRAMSTAIYFFVLNLIALGGGPTYVGFISEHLTEEHGPAKALQLALSSLGIVTVLAIVAFAVAARYLPRDWHTANSSNSAQPIVD